MDAIILAGGKTSQEDPLFELARGSLKSMIPIAGKPMVQWVLDAISKSKLIDRVVLIGIDDISSLKCGKSLTPLPDAGSLIKNIQQGAAYLQKVHPEESHVLSFSADIPGVTEEIIDHIAGEYQNSEFDIYYSVVEKETMEKRYPESRRTYFKFRDAEICGGDLNAYNKKVALDPDAVWVELIKMRKSPLKQAALIGLDTLLLLLLGRLTLDQGVKRVCRRLKDHRKSRSGPVCRNWHGCGQALSV